MHSSRLEPLRAEYGKDEGEFRLLMQRALALGGKGLSWRPGAGAAASGLALGGPMWTAWLGLNDDAYHFIVRSLDPHFLTQLASLDEANVVCQALLPGRTRYSST